MEMVDRMYRVMAGGVEVFLQIADDQDALQFVATLRYDLMSADESAEALAFYYPSVLAACVYASEGGEAGSEEEVLRSLCEDIPSLIEEKALLDTALSTEHASYALHSDNFWGMTLIADLIAAQAGK